MSNKNTDRIVSIMATIVAITAVGIAVFESTSQREHQRLSVYPRIELSQNTFSNVDASIGGVLFQKTIRNSGLGPAIIHNYEVTIDSVPVFGWDEVIETLTGSSPVERGQTGLRDGFVVQAGENFDILNAVLTIEQNTVLLEQLGRLKINTCYCSLYEECWTVVEFDQPQPIENCLVHPNTQWRNGLSGRSD